jgi:3-vinyl bacteriochlorophyllide hydratase
MAMVTSSPAINTLHEAPGSTAYRPLYTPEQRKRRDASRWTNVQGVLAIVQFFAFAISVALVLRFLITGEGLMAATISIVAKTMLLYTIMVTGCLWEKDVFGVYLLAPAFYWEDVVSFVVLALHTAYLCSLFTTVLDPRQQMFLALAAYATYAVNATQFVLKLRAARLGAKAEDERRARMPAAATHVNASQAGLPALSASASGPIA